MITPQMRTATSDFITGSCKSTTATQESITHLDKYTLLNLTSMALAFISINQLNFSIN